jgi:dihydroxyacetone kinase
MKKLINRPEDVVQEMIDGYLCLYPGLAKLSDHNVIIRKDVESIRNARVAVISGGGSGHEPAHAGYVGAGMLSAAVAGEVFTSPSVSSIYAAIKAATGAPGALLIVKNYTGDRLNFGLAAEMARAEGIPIEMVIVADDVALDGVQDNAGRRGIAGTVLVHKVAGAAAEQGKALPVLAEIARSAAEAIGTMGVCLSPGIIPAIGKPNFTLGDTEMELGLGIHGEPGVSRIPLESADRVVDKLLNSILSAKPLAAGTQVAVLINNLGATTSMELAIVAQRAVQGLRSRGLVVERIYAGTFMSSLEAAGVSISLLALDSERIALLDAPASAPAWPCTLPERPAPVEVRTVRSSKFAVAASPQGQPETAQAKRIRQALEDVCTAITNAESRLTALDQAVGDGDLGLSLTRGANAVRQSMPSYPLDRSAEMLRAIGATLQEALAGSSGPLYGVLFLRAGNSLDAESPEDPAGWAKAIKAGCDAVSALGGANAGDRTMLDALIPFADIFAAALAEGKPLVHALHAATTIAERSAEATASMVPKRGRSSYLGERALGHPDPGAIAVAIWLRALVRSLAGESSSLLRGS